MNAWKIAWFEYRRRIRSKWFIIGTFGMPILILVITLGTGYLAGSGAGIETKHFGMIDETARYGEQLTDILDKRFADKEAPPFRIAVTNGSYESLQTQFDALVDDKTLDGYFVLPHDFLSNPTIRNYSRSSSNFRSTDIIKSELKELLIKERAINLDLSAEVLDEIFFDIDIAHFEVGASEERETDELIADYIAPFIFMFLLFLGIFTGGQLLLRAVLEERSSRVIEVLLSTVSYNELMGGKILGLGLLGLTQSSIYLLVSFFAGNYYELSILTPAIGLLYFTYFILGYLLYAGIYIGVGALFDSEQEAQQAIQIITFIAIIPMVLWTLVIENPNSTLVNVLSYIPLVTPFFMMIKIAIGETTNIQVLTTIILMMVSVYGSIRLSAKVFRTGILLYGKRITLPEIYRWIRA
ncbi:MAG: ABC transporter permease [Candidatus Marinimicrobia bacterium]|jgi:ABC-2 type transport system permease protein|nr:ABC transporter permease [Candidatus Neomarinimicrobiota bacterium]MBT3630534.1 ABC transporter permease [Candidatus Neomarinimicrobiota bacterium]MBT3823397.1 ABC transporter permease [Candidatus Neomarinimicrobiota bacterium]MBT4131462.1 ABC transporter permease [Candidatus Neomarinimicrobiota bacterium]MBT4295821.1 ABC transporter permease [Candidatus Neomarinimicrobiota bacterium]